MARGSSTEAAKCVHRPDFFFNKHNFAAKIYINKTQKKTITDLVSHSCQGGKLACVSYSLPRTIKENIEFRKITKHQQKWETSGESEDSFQLLRVREWLQLEKQGHWWRQNYDVLRKVSFFLLSPNHTFAWGQGRQPTTLPPNPASTWFLNEVLLELSHKSELNSCDRLYSPQS